MSDFKLSIVMILWGAILLSTYNLVAYADNYIETLEGETADTSVVLTNKQMKNNEPKISSTSTVEIEWIGACTDMDGALPLNLSWGEFSAYLKKCAIGTSFYYQKLEFKLKHLIYDQYKKKLSVKLPVLRDNILNYHFLY